MSSSSHNDPVQGVAIDKPEFHPTHHSRFLWYKIPSRMLGITYVRYRCGQITSPTFIQHYSLKADKVI